MNGYTVVKRARTCNHSAEQVAELQEKAKGMRSPAPAAAFKTCSPSAAAVRIRLQLHLARDHAVPRWLTLCTQGG
jgi:hypothetical protein